MEHIEENKERPRPTQGRGGDAKHRTTAGVGLPSVFLEEKQKEEAKGEKSAGQNTTWV